MGRAMNQVERDAAILKRVTERTWTTEEMCAEMDAFNKDELPLLNKIVAGAKKFLKKHQIHLSEIDELTEQDIKAMKSLPPNPALKFYHCSTDRDEK